MRPEYYTGFDSNGKFTHLGHAHHVAVATALAASGIVDLGVRYKLVAPERVSYLFAVFLFLIDGWLMTVHNDSSLNEGELSSTMHRSSALDVMMLVTSLVLEMFHRRSVGIALLRPIVGLHEAILFITMSFVLFQPCCPWDDRHIPFFLALYVGYYMLVCSFVLILVMTLYRHSGDSKTSFAVSSSYPI
ncbi:unnamed protein product [Darwinula stevensoni]|uniref:Transmembrane protein 45B n=1 Tax=Darwinula stevensoni TaxID=69355 RepID=A0A7R9A651_9CRUS|nr:unnamed protein product [Darwinula stevensoni]CAG0886754.1 unnamed protein product [Darwinula stevensoni]